MRLLFHHFPALRELHICGGGQTSLPESMQHLTSLESFTLDSCDSISALLEWLGDLSSLKSLVISGCRSIESLPSCIQHLPKLQKLEIFLCGQKLKEWCESEENKAKLAHIKVQVSSLPNCTISNFSLQVFCYTTIYALCLYSLRAVPLVYLLHTKKEEKIYTRRKKIKKAIKKLNSLPWISYSCHA
jgi:Leucine-rich repeat (LRR) protein